MAWERELERTPLFAGAPPSVVEAVARQAVHRRYRAGTVIFVQGDPGGRCFVIVAGTVKVSAFNDEGREALLAILGTGDLLGELSLFEDVPRSADAVVLEDAELLSLDSESVVEAVSRHPELAVGMLRVLARRLRATNESLQDAAFFDVPGRVSRRLADLADAHGLPVEGGTLIDVPVSQEALANMVGATRESVNKALAVLARRGLVSRRGRRYLVADVSALRDRAR